MIVAVRAAVAGAAVALLAATSGCTGVDLSPTPTTRITCAPTSGSPDLHADVTTLRARARGLGRGEPKVTVRGATVVIEVAAATDADARGLCADATLEFRGLVAPAGVVRCSGAACATGSVGDLDSLRLPSASGVYAVNGLRPDVSDSLIKPLAAVDCTSVARDRNDPTGYRLACGPDPARASTVVAYLLGPVVVAGDEIARAVATPPGGSTTEWAIDLTLDPAGTRAWATYTTAHNSNGIDAGSPTTCNAAAPCPDYVGFVSQGRVLSLPFTVGPITGSRVRISGSFTRSTATALARSLNGGQLRVPLRLVSVTGR